MNPFAVVAAWAAADPYRALIVAIVLLCWALAVAWYAEVQA